MNRREWLRAVETAVDAERAWQPRTSAGVVLAVAREVYRTANGDGVSKSSQQRLADETRFTRKVVGLSLAWLVDHQLLAPDGVYKPSVKAVWHTLTVPTGAPDTSEPTRPTRATSEPTRRTRDVWATTSEPRRVSQRGSQPEGSLPVGTKPPSRVRAREDRALWPAPVKSGGEDQRGQDREPHPYEPNARRALDTLRAERHLTLSVAELLALAYDTGHGDPWQGYLAVKDATDASLAGARDARAVVRSRLGRPGEPARLDLAALA